MFVTAFVVSIADCVSIRSCGFRINNVPAQAEMETSLFSKTSRTNARGEGASVKYLMAIIVATLFGLTTSVA